MADQKISQLTAATTPLSGTEVLPIVQSGATKQVSNNDLRPKQIQSNATSGVLQIVGPAAAATRVMTVPDANFTAARTDAAQTLTGNQTITNGNVVVSSGYGIDFSATPGTGTSELFDDYEEGAFTPTLVSGAGESITYTGQFGSYTKIGRSVYVIFQIRWTAFTPGSNTHLRIGGLPFTTNKSSGVEITYQFGFGNPYNTTYGFTVADITATEAVSSPSGTEVYVMRGGQSGTTTVYVRSSEVKTTGGSIYMAFTYNTTT